MMRVGLVGCGSVSREYLSNLANSYERRIVTCADLDDVSAKAVASEFGLRKSSTVEELLGDTEVDLVFNLTPPAIHAEVSLRALVAGKHIYTEKPIARNDPAYPDQNYWRGRIWGPMNFLVYLSLCKYDLPQARKDLSEKSKQLLLKEWLENGHVYENYDGDSGVGGNVKNADAFYHWGGLLGIITLMEEGLIEVPGKPL